MRSFYIIPLMLIAGACGRDKPEPRQEYGGLAVEIPRPSCGDRPIKSSGSMLAIPSRTQECSERCWAAVLAMVGRYFGKETRECEFAGARRADDGACCMPDDCENPLCNQPASEAEFGALLLRKLEIKSQFVHRPLAETEVQAELSNGRPVAVGFGESESAHIALIVGFIIVEDELLVRRAVYHVADPWPQIGLVQRSYQEIIFGPANDPPLPWVSTWFRIAPRADGCVERFDPACGCNP